MSMCHKYNFVEPNSERWLSIENLPNEEWRDIKDFESLYQVSNYGRVKNNNYHIMRFGYNKKGYLQVCLVKNGKKYTKRIHRLVAIAFIPNPDNLPQVNHKDENKNNNCVSNLEWCNVSYNIDYSLSKPIIQYDIYGNFIKRWKSINDACRNLNYATTFISRCCSGKCKSAYNYVWKYDKKENK